MIEKGKGTHSRNEDPIQATCYVIAISFCDDYIHQYYKM